MLFPMATSYFEEVVEKSGGLEAASEFFRLFHSAGDIHGSCTGPGPGLTLADGTMALIRWVEHDEAPQELIAERFDAQAGQVVATRPLFSYPSVTVYSGSGDPAEAASYVRAERN
ncbi:tannase/feruloyl esterase family alpha/beta hydrolase [Kineosporia babensis]